MVWIEDAGAHIARGEAESVTREGLRVRLADRPEFAKGEEVAVRIAFERGAATVATTARVDLVSGETGLVECRLVWSGPASERRELDAWLARAA
jgi:hypothetical protein